MKPKERHELEDIFEDIIQEYITDFPNENFGHLSFDCRVYDLMEAAYEKWKAETTAEEQYISKFLNDETTKFENRSTYLENALKECRDVFSTFLVSGTLPKDLNTLTTDFIKSINEVLTNKADI